jgi:sugar/nucleoside kinase (ribokinase family)
MSLLVVGSVALDSIETPFQLVGVVGSDYPIDRLTFLKERGVDLAGLARAEGESFRWSGVYSYDLNTRDTLETRLGVFAEFSPRIPDQFRDAQWVFLGNIDPELQLDVLRQIHTPGLVACDTMNYWIEGKREALLELLERVDLLLVNDSEARELTGEHNLLHAARWIQAHGPQFVVVKKGEHGAILFTPETIFFAPGFPLEEVFDPTGAGDAFAGGLMGWLAYVNSTADEELRRGMIYGSALGSFAVERFGVERLRDLAMDEIHDRVREFRAMTSFEQALPSHA